MKKKTIIYPCAICDKNLHKVFPKYRLHLLKDNNSNAPVIGYICYDHFKENKQDVE